MKKIKKIKSTNLKLKPNITQFTLIGLYLYIFEAQLWVYAIFGTLVFIYLILYVISRYYTEEIDIFKEDEPIKDTNKSKWKERLDEMKAKKSKDI